MGRWLSVQARRVNARKRNARWLVAGLLLVGSLLAACGGEDELPVPTVAPWPTLPPTATAPPSATPTPTASPTATSTVTVTPSATPTATATATNTATVTPSATFTPSNTPLPSPTPTITPVQIAVTNGIGANVRSGPGITYPVIAEMPADAVFDAVAYATNAITGDVWYVIELKGGATGWISSVVAGRVNNVPLAVIAQAATVPASPTPSPTLTPSPTATLPVGANARISGGSRVNLRSGPGTHHGALGLLNSLAPLKLIGRNEATSWYYINTFDGRTGWVFGDLVEVVAVDTGTLPVEWEEPVVVVNTGSGAIPSGPGGGSLSGGVLANVRDIYRHGQARGNRPNSFIVIGDSVSARSEQWSPLFYAFQFGSYDLGHAPHLQTTIDYYRATGSFGGDYQTARAGFATHFLLDATWADPALCAPGETPIDCEYRVKRPATAIIYLGLMDMQISTIAAYQQNMHTIIQMLLDRDVIPVLNTVTLADNSEIHQRHGADMDQINAIVRSLAASYQVPLIDFARVAYSLPNQGCLQDGAHLSYRVDGVTSFNGDEQRYGRDLREYLTLKLLDDLRVHVFGG